MDLPLDKRFSHIGKDPRFQMMPKQERKVKIDKRFQDMFKNKQFKLKYTVDKRGRPLNQSSSENLKQFYELSDDSNDESDKIQSEEKSFSAKKKLEKKKSSKLSNSNLKGKQSNKKKLIELLKKRKERLQKKSIRDNKKQSKNVLNLANEDEMDPSDDSDVEFDPLGVDVARGKGNVESSSESESESEEELEHEWGELDADAPRSEDTSRRIAVCNADWDRIKAADLMAVFHSFKPTGGLVQSVKIYPSEFGLKKLEEEDKHGPVELLQDDGKEIDCESLEGQKLQMERLRKYQLQRLRYYYAVVECDSPQTAAALYENCDNLELETTSTRLDLRFIPDDVTFDHEPTSYITDAGDMTTYKPSKFKTTALHQSKVELTWDETDRERTRIMQQAFENDEFNDQDMKMLIASSDDDEDEEDISGVEKGVARSNDEDQIAKYRSLLKEVNEKEKRDPETNEMEMEVSWESGLKEATEALVKKKMTEKEEQLTPWEKYMKKRKEKKMEKIAKKQKSVNQKVNPKGKKRKRKEEDMKPEELEEKERKRAELELLLMEDEDDGKKHFSLDAILENEQTLKKKKKKKIKSAPFQDDFEIDVKDPRFSAVFTSHHFAIDPSDPHFKRTKAMQALIEEKQKRRGDKEKAFEIEGANEDAKPKKGDKEELSMLVKSIKNKTNQFHERKGKKKSKFK
ncbi:ESF1 homolog [Anneissia japonica]|uniref:ESF1 homolog n=1 Tax=Anneissia japonica TaxID=1529436 RepID=UPI001425ADFD|nr:ESF1 homolog [Anneissia japonica]